MASRITTPIRRERESSKCRDSPRVSLGALGSGKIVLGECSRNGTDGLSSWSPTNRDTSKSGHVHSSTTEHPSHASFGEDHLPSSSRASMFMMDNDQHEVVRHWNCRRWNPVVIEGNVWISSKVVTRPGVRICDRAESGAGNFISKNIATRCSARVPHHLAELDDHTIRFSASRLPPDGLGNSGPMEAENRSLL
jgi:hypothetical protein